MRVIVTSVALVLVAGAALAQTGSITSGPPAPSATTPAKPDPVAVRPAARTGKAAIAEAKAECMGMWDAGTHMSKREWANTCDRIQTRLDNLKIENLDIMGTGMRKKPGVGKQGSNQFAKPDELSFPGGLSPFESRIIVEVLAAA